MSLKFPVSLVGKRDTGYVFPEASTAYGEGDVVLKTVTGNIPNSWMLSRTDCVRVEIGSTCQSIGSAAFRYCTNLTGELHLPEGLTYVGNLAFDDTIFTNQLVIPSTLVTIGQAAFFDFGGLATTYDLVIPDTVTTLVKECFKFWGGNTPYGGLVLGNSITNIPRECFESARFKGPIVIPSNVSFITQYGFRFTTITGGNKFEINRVTAPTLGYQGLGTNRNISVPSNATGYDTGNWVSDGHTVVKDLPAG